ncbi:MAG: type II toxin-antitoxin system VapB family antitoxin [Actinomycetota bacterium]
MRTNIVIDDELVEKARRLTGIKTKRALVDMALRELVARKERKGILSLEGKVEWEGDLEEWRKARFDTG